MAISLGVSYYENGTNTYMKIGSSGKLFGQPEGIPLPVGGNLLLSDAIALLYKTLPEFEWYDLFSFSFSVIALYCLILVLTFKIEKRTIKHWILGFLGICMYLPNLAMYEFTRISMILGFCAGLLILKTPVLNWRYVALNILLAASMLIRPDGYALTLAYLIPIIFLIREWSNSIKLAPAVFVFLGVILLLNLPASVDDANYLELRPYQLTLFDYDVTLKIPFKNQEDSILVDAVRQTFLNDPKHITKEVLATYVPPLDKTPNRFFEYLVENPIDTSSLRSLFSTLDPPSTYTPWLAVLFMLLITSVGENPDRLKLAIYGLGGLASFVIVGVYFKTVSHVLFPSSLCIVAGMLFLSKQAVNPLKLTLLSSVFLIGGILISGKRISGSDRMQIDSIEELNQHVTSNYSQFNDQIFIYNLPSLIRTNSRVFGCRDQILPNSFSFDNGFLYHSQAYRNKSVDYFGSYQSNDILKAILAKPEKFIFVSTPSRLEFLQGYFSGLYSLNFEYLIEYLPSSDLPKDRIPSLIRITPVDG